MKLEEIGFYTLTDQRARTATHTSPLSRCELLLTDRCNLKCPYCRGLKPEYRGDMPFEQAKATLDLWIREGLRNVRLSGGEPTLYPRLEELVKQCREGGVERIAISSNGVNRHEVYDRLIEAGVNDFAISLDSGCCATGEVMAGGVKGSWNKAVDTIQYLSGKVYLTVGIVFTETNADKAIETVMFADSLGPSDIRTIPSAQFNRALVSLADLPAEILAKYPILRYRVSRVKVGKHIRGLKEMTDWPEDLCDLKEEDCGSCPLVLDDIAVAGDDHYPCIVYLREQGKPIGKVGPNMRAERLAWAKRTDTFEDPICSANCLDFCSEYNNRWFELHPLGVECVLNP